jgi:hypothetical protein
MPKYGAIVVGFSLVMSTAYAHAQQNPDITAGYATVLLPAGCTLRSIVKVVGQCHVGGCPIAVDLSKCNPTLNASQISDSLAGLQKQIVDLKDALDAQARIANSLAQEIQQMKATQAQPASNSVVAP